MSLIFDVLSVVSVVGVWPRFIEPRCVTLTVLPWNLPPQFAYLQGKRFALLSDLHFNAHTSSTFLDRVVRRLMRQKPDAIFLTGDFICYSSLENKERLLAFLRRLQAPYGTYCVLGNHDYASYVSRDSSGEFTLCSRPNPLTGLQRGIKTLFAPPCQGYTMSDEVRMIPPHADLLELLREASITLLENTTVTLPIGLNITGLGEYSLDRCRPDTAFSGYQKDLPGIVLTHNPDAFPLLFDYPGDWIFAGHTHGEQIHLPFCRPLSRKLTRLTHLQYTRGLSHRSNKNLYVTRGLGSPKPFRLFSPPEIVILEGVHHGN